jgi:hypothetical protein
MIGQRLLKTQPVKWSLLPRTGKHRSCNTIWGSRIALWLPNLATRNAASSRSGVEDTRFIPQKINQICRLWHGSAASVLQICSGDDRERKGDLGEISRCSFTGYRAKCFLGRDTERFRGVSSWGGWQNERVKILWGLYAKQAMVGCGLKILTLLHDPMVLVVIFRFSESDVFSPDMFSN